MERLPDKKEKRGEKGRRASRAVKAVVLLFILSICAYIIRLEAHTRADVFLPANYHSVVKEGHEGDAEGANQALDTYYAQYARQEGRPYTIRQDLLLSRLAGLRAPEGFQGEAEGVSVRALCGEVRRIAADASIDVERVLGVRREDILATVSEIEEDAQLSGLIIREYIENGTGFAGYVLGVGDEITIALRGTDDMADTLDNFLLLPFNLSAQYGPVRALLARYDGASRIWLTGHSKGGHNAIYAASIDARCHATGFNAPGFGIFLTDTQHDGLERGVNYVINGDVTGFLLFHLERRIVLESTAATPPEGLSFTNRHRLVNFYAIDDLTVAASIEPFVVWVEWITQTLWLLLVSLAVYGIAILAGKLYRLAAQRIASGAKR